MLLLTLLACVFKQDTDNNTENPDQPYTDVQSTPQECDEKKTFANKEDAEKYLEFCNATKTDVKANPNNSKNFSPTYQVIRR